MNTTSRTLSSTIFKFNAMFLCVVNVLFTFAEIILNSVVIMSLWNSQLGRRLCYFMILIMACSGLAVVVVSHPFMILNIIASWMNTNAFHPAWLGYLHHLYAISFIAYFIMTLERYIALVYPFFHEKFVTKSKLISAFVLFQLPLFFLYLPKLYSPHLLLVIYASLEVILVVTCILNFRLFSLAKTIRKRTVVPQGNFDESNNVESRNVDREKAKATLANLRNISTCLLAVVCLIICHFPMSVKIGIQLAGQTDLMRSENMFIFTIWAETLMTINSSLNCLIFFYKNSVLRRHGKEFLNKCFV